MSAPMLCPNSLKACLPCDEDPISNYSSEDGDPPVFCETVTFTGEPGLGVCFEELSCTKACCSTESDEEAYLCALREAQECVWSTWRAGSCPPSPPPCTPICPAGCPPLCPPLPPPPRIYSNVAQTCQVLCVDGSTFSATVNAGEISALSQVQADAEAYSVACKRAKAKQICISTASPLDSVCKGASYTLTIHAAGGIPWIVTVANFGGLPAQCLTDGIGLGSRFQYIWSVVSGSLPDGLTLHPCSGIIDGTPTTEGVSNFTLRATDGAGDYQQKAFQINVAEINTAATLPDGTIGTSYSQSLSLLPTHSGSEIWTQVGGAMPPGLSLLASGSISGIPTGSSASYTITLQCEVEIP